MLPSANTFFKLTNSNNSSSNLGRQALIASGGIDELSLDLHNVALVKNASFKSNSCSIKTARNSVPEGPVKSLPVLVS